MSAAHDDLRRAEAAVNLACSALAYAAGAAEAQGGSITLTAADLDQLRAVLRGRPVAVTEWLTSHAIRQSPRDAAVLTAAPTPSTED